LSSVLIVGCGDIGCRVAQLCQAQGQSVVGLIRSKQSEAKLTAKGVTALQGDLDRPETLRGLPLKATVVYYLVPPPTHGTTGPRINNLLKTLNSNKRPDHFVLISTSAVYGDTKGVWVNEDTPPNPTTDRGHRRLHAENSLHQWAEKNHVTWTILRVPGIYGPGRLPVQALKQGRPVLLETESGFTNRIHADDLARICVAAGDLQSKPGLYNVSDGHPGTMTQYFNAIADVLHLSRPPVVTWAEASQVLSADMLSYLKESRRIDNQKMLRELKVKLLYPTLEAGLAASVDKEN
jgi:nucleoside-diphosphate-sugar epimerase